MPLSHEDARKKVCAICINGHGAKAARELNKKEEQLIDIHVVRGYKSQTCFSHQEFVSGVSLI